MNELCEFIRVDLVRATLLLSAAAILLGGLWRVLRIRAAGMESGAWLVVLGHGFLLAGIALPWPDFLGTQQTDVVVALSTPLAPPTSEPSAISVNGIEPIAENALGSGNDVESRNSSPNAPIVATADSITRSLLESEPEGSPGSTAKLWILKLIAVTWLTGVLSGDEKALEPKSDDAREDLVVRSVMKLGDRRFAHRSSVDQVALAPDGKWIASTCFNRSSPRVEIWDAATGERSGTLVADDTDQRGIESIAVSPDGKWLIGGQQDGWINVWRTADWKLVSRSKSHDAGVSAIAFSPDSTLFASGTERGTVQLCRVGSPAILEHRWQIEKTPAPQGDISISGTSGVAALVFSTDGGRLLTGTAGDARISVIDVASGEIIRTIEHAHPVGNMNPGLSSLHALSETDVLSVGARTLNRKNFPPGLIAYSRNVQITELKVWNTETGELSRDLTAGRFDVGFGHAAVAPDRRTAVLGCRDKLMFFDLTEGVELRTVAIPGWWGKTPSIASDRVAVGTEQRISVWDLRTGRPVLPSPERNLSGIIDCDWFDDGRVVALVDQNGILNNWDVNPGRYRRQESFGPGGHARSLARSADGSMFAAAGEALDATGRDFGLAQVWKADGSRYWQYHLNSRVRDCSMSSDGSHMVVASSNGSIGDTRFHLLKVEGNVLISAGGFPPESEQGLWQCETLAFTADNESVWVANSNCELVRWDIKEKKAGRTLVLDWRLVIPGPEKRQLFLWNAVFCMANQTVVISALDHIMVWDLTTGQLKLDMPVPGIAKGFTTLAFSHDGRYVAAAEVNYAGAPGSDTIRVFDLSERKEILAVTPLDNRATALSFSPDSKRLLAGYSDGTGEIWNVEIEEPAVDADLNM